MTRNVTTTSAGARTQIQKPAAKIHWRDEHGHYKISVGWEADGCRYHIWLNPDGTPEENKLYKNPSEELKTSVAGFFRTKILSANASVNAAMIAEAMARVDLDEARACFDQKEKREKAQRLAAEEARKKEEAIQNAAPDLYAAVKRFLAADEAYLSIDAPGGDKLDELGFSKEELRAAIAKAERTSA